MINLKHFLAARANLYAILALCFHYPDVNFTRALVKGEVIKVLEESVDSLGEEYSSLKDGINLVKNYIKKYKDKDIEEVWKALAVEYTRIFIDSKHVPCPPYESFYVNGGYVMQQSTKEVLRSYLSSGFKLSDNFKDLPDHIAVELEFVSLSIRKCLELPETSTIKELEDCVENARTFIKEHLARWVSSFYKRVHEFSRCDFFKGAALLLKEFISIESRLL